MLSTRNVFVCWLAETISLEFVRIISKSEMLLTITKDGKQNRRNISVMTHASHPTKKLNICRGTWSAAQRLDVLAKVYLDSPPLYIPDVGWRLNGVSSCGVFRYVYSWNVGSNRSCCFQRCSPSSVFVDKSLKINECWRWPKMNMEKQLMPLRFRMSSLVLNNT